MAIGRKRRKRQRSLFVESGSLRTPGHPFYERLNKVLEKHGFDEFVEQECSRFYAGNVGRPGVPPGVYFRMLMIGYFEKLDSERGIAWRCRDSLALREFLGFELNESPPDHSTVSRTRRLMDVETHQSVFSWILRVLAKAGLVKGETIGIDSTTLEANAALRSIVRKDTGEGYEDYLRQLAASSGIETPTRADLARLDKDRKGKGSNDDWQNPHDPDAQIVKMKSGKTHLSHKDEHAVDMATGVVLAVTLHGGAKGDTKCLPETLAKADEEVYRLWEDLGGETIAEDREVVTDKSYHSNETLLRLKHEGYRTYISEPARGRRCWQGKEEHRDAVYENRRRIHRARGKRLLRRRGEVLERGFTHYLDSGGMRRTHLRRHPNILKRLLVQVASFNLGILMRKLVGAGTPRELAAQFSGLISALNRLLAPTRTLCRVSVATWVSRFGSVALLPRLQTRLLPTGLATGC